MKTVTRFEKSNNRNKKVRIDHKVIEIFGVDSDIILNCESILPKIKRFSKSVRLKILAEKYHDFKPQGATLIFILSSSHLAVHTWPENNYLHIDLVTCAKTPSNKKIINALKKLFGVSENQINVRKIKYGN